MATYGGWEPESSRPPPISARTMKRLRWVVIGLVVLFIIWAAAGDIIWFWLNIVEFGDLFIRPIYFAFLGGLIFSIIALFRLDFRNRRSLVWWAIRLAIRFIRQKGLVETIPPNYIDFKTFKMTRFNFAAWQVTKVILGMLIFAGGSVFFGMAIDAVFHGWESYIGQIGVLFSLPFITPSLEVAYAQEKVIPLIPALTLIIPSILGAIGTRLVLLVGLTQVIRIITPTVTELGGGRPQYGWRIAVIEALIALGLFWSLVNSFFPYYIDYNTKYVIGGLAAAGVIFLIFAYLDAVKGKGLSILMNRRLALRFITIIIVALLVGSITAVNSSIADARKTEWLGPYVTQEISVNRYLADIDKVKEIPYNFSVTGLSAADINPCVERETELLDSVRLWDWQAAFAKLKPEIGLIPYIDYQDSDIIRFNKTLYWSASMKPILPETVLPADRWYAEHLVYTHAPGGFLMLGAHDGRLVDPDDFFKQRKIYYGEGGLLEEDWAAYPVERQRSDELGDYFYSGTGGLDVAPPLSWIFEFNFFLAFMDQAVHIMRYKDDFQKMEMLFPYFQYNWGTATASKLGTVDMLPVTDGENTYYLMPLIVNLDTGNVPWSQGNPFMRLVGYAMIDIYHGDIKIIVLGDDFFSNLFKTVYSDFVIQKVPDWLKDQLRYPQELFEWKTGMYSYFHVTDPSTYIQAKEFFEIPEGMTTYYITARPPDFDEVEYVGLLSLELRGALGRNLAGYMIVRNEYDHFGEMNFYEVALDSSTKLLGPTAVREALEKNSDFATLRTLLREPRVGDNILYRVGDHDVYFIPVYTAGAGGVVTELGAVAAVGAAFTGEYYVGLDVTKSQAPATAEGAFRAFLAELSGVEVIEVLSPVEEKEMEQRMADIMQLFEDRYLTVAQPTATYPDVSFFEGNFTYMNVNQWNATEEMVNSFIETWCVDVDKVLTWTADSITNFGVLVNNRGVIELHYISIAL